MKKFPWYDSVWLTDYANARMLIAERCPQRMADFDRALEILQTPKSFEVIDLPGLLDSNQLAECREFIASLSLDQQEKHELFMFGRLVVHNHEFFNRIQESLTDKVSSLVGEIVEPSYNFLAMYRSLGVCTVHMDSPEAKYTIDCCIDQSDEWPIYISQRRDWVFDLDFPEDWHDQIRNDPANRFGEYRLTPGNAIIFSGSSQWHYRDRMLTAGPGSFCNLIFFHFIPAGSRPLLNSANWADITGIPELREIQRMREAV